MINPIREQISVILIFAFLATAFAAQDKVRPRVEEESGATAQRKAEEAQRKAQAVDILKGDLRPTSPLAGTSSKS